MPKLKSCNKDFFKTWSPEMAYVLGFFAADGYLAVNTRGGQFWCFQIKDKELLEKIKDVLGSNHAIGIRTSKLSQNPLYRLQIGSIEMCSDLRKLGFTQNKTTRLVFPQIPAQFLPDFVRGYFDGDGNVWSGIAHKNRNQPSTIIQTCFTSCSKSFLEKLHIEIERETGNKGAIHPIKGKACYRLQYSTQPSLKLYDFMYNGAVGGIFLKRKKIVFEKFICSRSSTG